MFLSLRRYLIKLKYSSISYLTQNYNILRLQIAYRRQSEIISHWLIIDTVHKPQK